MIDPFFNQQYGTKWRVKYVIYLVARVFSLVLFRILFRMRVYGLKNIPRSGGALMIGNHVHNADPVLMMTACPRPTHFMAKEEIWKVPVASWIATKTGAFPVRRGTADRAALRRADEILQDGRLVVIFPEGTRSVTGGLKKAFPGVSLIATKSGAPLIPVAVLGTEDIPGNGAKQKKRDRFWPKTAIVFGEPFHLLTHKPDGDRWPLEELSDAMMIEIARILPASRHGEFAAMSDVSHPAVRRDKIVFSGTEPRRFLGWLRRERVSDKPEPT